MANDISDAARVSINTDRELFREVPGDFYSPSLHVTESGKVGINVGGNVFVADLKQWHHAMFMLCSRRDAYVNSTD